MAYVLLAAPAAGATPVDIFMGDDCPEEPTECDVALAAGGSRVALGAKGNSTDGPPDDEPGVSREDGRVQMALLLGRDGLPLRTSLRACIGLAGCELP